MKDYKAFLFDFDGTLMDTSPGVLACMSETLEEIGMPQQEKSVVLTFIGPPGSDWFYYTYHWSREQADAANKVFKRRFEENGHYLNAIPYPGIVEFLQALKDAGKFTATATNKYLNQAQGMIDNFGWNRYFDRIGAAQMGLPTTKADIIKQMADLAGAGVSETLMLGDSRYDAEAAQIAGADFLGLTFGFGFKTKEDVDKYPNIGCAASIDEVRKITGI